MTHVGKLGFTMEAIHAAGRELGFSSAVANVFERKEAELIEHFLEDCRSLTGWLWTCWDGEPIPMSCAPCKFSELLYVWLVFWGSWAYLGSVVGFWLA